MIATSNRGKRIFFEGNSLTNYGNGNVPNVFSFANVCYNALIPTNKIAWFSNAIGGQKISTMITDFPTNMAPYLGNGDHVFLWEGANQFADSTGAQVYAMYQTYAGLVKAKGAKITVASSIPSGGVNEAEKLIFDALLRAGYASFADGLCDFRSQTHFQVAADANDTSYFNADKVHLTTLGYNTLGAYAATRISL